MTDTPKDSAEEYLRNSGLVPDYQKNNYIWEIVDTIHLAKIMESYATKESKGAKGVV